VESTFASGLSGLGEMAFNSTGNLFVASSSGTIYEYTPGGVQSTFASGLNEPVGLAIQPVPEPCTLTLLGVSAIGLLIRRRK
jgi:hypothetical protein